MRRTLYTALALAMLVVQLLAAMPVIGATGRDEGVQAPLAGSRGPVNDTDSEPNDEVAEATNITGNVSVAGGLAGQDLSDFYRVALNKTPPADRLNASLAFTSNRPTAKAYLTILDPNEFRLDHVRASAGAAAVNASAMAVFTDYYYVGVIWDVTNDNSATISYTLNVTLLNMSFTPDGNDAPADAVTITNGLDIANGLNELTDAADYYTMHMVRTVSMADVVYINVAPAGTMDITVEVYSSAWTFMWQVNDGAAGTTEVVYMVAPTTDDYFFRIWANTGAGAYDLVARAGSGFIDNDNDLANATDVTVGVAVPGNVTDDFDGDDFYTMNLTLGEEVTANLTVQGYNATQGLPIINVWLYNSTSYVKNSTNNNLPSKSIWYEADTAGWYFIRIGASDTSFGMYKLNVTVVSPPKIMPHAPTVSMDEDTTKVLDVGTIFQDPQGKPLVFGVSGNKTLSVVIDGHNATVNSTVANWYGSETVTFSATNGLGKTAYADIKFIVAPMNDAPVALQSSMDFQTEEDKGKTLGIGFLATKFSDVDGDELAFTFKPDTNITYNVTADTIALIPNKDWNGVANLTLVASDPSGLNATMTVNLEVTPIEDVPTVVAQIPKIDLQEDGATTINLSLYFRDPDGGALTYGGYPEEGPGGLRHITVTINGSLANVTLTPDWHGRENITFTVKDGANNTASIEAIVDVSSVNDAPKVDQTYWIMYTQETWVVEDKVGTFDLSKLFVDADKDVLTFVIIGSGSHIKATMNGNILTVTPDPNWFGVENVNLTARDPAGLSIARELPVTVINDNDRPVVTGGALSPKSGNEKTSFKFTLIVTDIDGDDPVVSVLLDGTEYRMSKESGDIRTGATYTYSTRLKGGSHTYSFKADDNQHTATSTATLNGGTIKVEKPLDNSVYAFYAIVIVIIVFIVVLIWVAWSSRSRRMKEFDDSWDDEEEEEIGEEE